MSARMLLLVYAILPIVSGMFVSTPGIRKFKSGSNGAFQWTINGTVISYDFFWGSWSIDPNRIVMHNETSFIFVAILNVQSSDAGNYTLQVYFDGDPLPSIDTTACLYIYDTTGIVTQTEGTTGTTVNEGSSAKFTCSGSSTSLPAQYRPDPSTLVYTIYVCDLGTIHHLGDGSILTIYTGKVDDRYVLIDNQTLLINPVKRSDYGRCVQCKVCEDNYCGVFTSGNYLHVTNFKPLLDVHSSMKYTAAIGETVIFYTYYFSDPVISSSSWSFSTSQMGPFYPLPTSWTTTRSSSTGYEQLAFNITSSNQYGFYLLTLTNSQGTSIAKFEVNAPGIPPDQPIQVRSFVTPTSVNIQWNSAWDNGRQQYFRISLNNLKSNTTIDQRVELQDQYHSKSSGFYEYINSFYPKYHFYYYPNSSIYSNYIGYINFTYITNFTDNIFPETDYEVLLWAVNEFGSSETVRLAITTPARPTLIVSSDSISIFGRISVIHFSVEGGPATQLVVQCYELKLITTTSKQFSVNASTRQVNMTIPTGSEYRFNLLLYNGEELVAYQTVGIPGEAAPSGSTNCSKYDTSPMKESASTSANVSPSETMTAVIILAVLLGVAVIFGLFELAWILNNQCRATKNANSLNDFSQVPNVSDKVENDYTEQSFFNSLTDQTGASTEGNYEEIQNGQENTSI